jgi:hypothetical protein
VNLVPPVGAPAGGWELAMSHPSDTSASWARGRADGPDRRPLRQP